MAVSVNGTEGALIAKTSFSYVSLTLATNFEMGYVLRAASNSAKVSELNT